MFDDNGKITRVKARLISPPKQDDNRNNVAALLKPLDGYVLLSVKCNNPAAGAAIGPQHLPVLIDNFANLHHPVGMFAGGQAGDEFLWQLDYCGIPDSEETPGLVIAKNGSVKTPFVDKLWLTEQAPKITEFYVLYLVQTGKNTIISSVRLGKSQNETYFTKCEGFLIR